jgi:hypothetical protein
MRGTMDDLISRLTAEQATKVLERLGRKEGPVGEAVVAEVKNLLSESESPEIVDVHEVADDVFCALNSVDVEDCWDQSGCSRYGYTSPDEAAEQIVEAELQQFFDQTEEYHKLGLLDLEATYCMGVLLGIYRYERESKSEFRSWCKGIPGLYADLLLTQWQERTKGTAAIPAVRNFVRERCPEWTKSPVLLTAILAELLGGRRPAGSRRDRPAD